MPKNSAAGGIYGGFTARKIRRLIRRAVIFPADFRRTNFRRRIRRSAAAEGSIRCTDFDGEQLVLFVNLINLLLCSYNGAILSGSNYICDDLLEINLKVAGKYRSHAVIVVNLMSLQRFNCNTCV